MRKAQKEQILEILLTLGEAHVAIKNYIENRAFETVFALLEDCQQTAITIGGMIEESKGEDHPSVRTLEEYCDRVYQVGQGIAEGDMSAQKAYKLLHKSLIQVGNSVEKDVSVRLEMVFMPYKASMWDSLESVWRAADEDPDCDAYVIPIPYYDRNPDLSFGAFHYEGSLFPKDVPITHYEAYSLEKRRPDVIYIHNPYDENNKVTSIDPRFYSSKLKEYTDMLVYIPYYVVARGVFNEALMMTSALVYADCIILQSKLVCEQYKEVYKKYYENPAELSNGKFIALGSPKFDAVINAKKENYQLPEDWTSIIDGRKVVFLNTSIGSALKDTEKFLLKLCLLLDEFKNCEDMVLWWRPHPLLEGTLNSMRPHLAKEYKEIVAMYRQNKIGIYDDTPDLYRAIAWGDIYYSDIKSSIVALCCATGKSIVEFFVEKGEATGFLQDGKRNTRDNSSFDVLLRNENPDGTSGMKVHEYICQEVLK